MEAKSSNLNKLSYAICSVRKNEIVTVDHIFIKEMFDLGPHLRLGLVVKAVQVVKRCTVLRFETKAQLRRLCGLLGESALQDRDVGCQRYQPQKTFGETI